ncbi:MAG: PilZ domain-containing protein [Polyangiaceae bacterium]
MRDKSSLVDRVILSGRARRRAVRKQVAVSCQTVREHDFRLVGSRMLDLSAEGMLVLAEDSAKIGDELIVSFQSPELGLWFDLDAKVARLVGGRRRGDPGPAIGVEFTKSTALVRHMLRSLFHKCKATIPARPMLEERARALGGPLPYGQVARGAYV